MQISCLRAKRALYSNVCGHISMLALVTATVIVLLSGLLDWSFVALHFNLIQQEATLIESPYKMCVCVYGGLTTILLDRFAFHES